MVGVPFRRLLICMQIVDEWSIKAIEGVLLLRKFYSIVYKMNNACSVLNVHLR